jgi:hypothetical protein
MSRMIIRFSVKSSVRFNNVTRLPEEVGLVQIMHDTIRTVDELPLYAKGAFTRLREESLNLLRRAKAGEPVSFYGAQGWLDKDTLFFDLSCAQERNKLTTLFHTAKFDPAADQDLFVDNLLPQLKETPVFQHYAIQNVPGLNGSDLRIGRLRSNTWRVYTIRAIRSRRSAGLKTTVGNKRLFGSFPAMVEFLKSFLKNPTWKLEEQKPTAVGIKPHLFTLAYDLLVDSKGTITSILCNGVRIDEHGFLPKHVYKAVLTPSSDIEFGNYMDILAERQNMTVRRTSVPNGTHFVITLKTALSGTALDMLVTSVIGVTMDKQNNTWRFKAVPAALLGCSLSNARTVNMDIVQSPDSDACSAILYADDLPIKILHLPWYRWKSFGSLDIPELPAKDNATKPAGLSTVEAKPAEPQNVPVETKPAPEAIITEPAQPKAVPATPLVPTAPAPLSAASSAVIVDSDEMKKYIDGFEMFTSMLSKEQPMPIRFTVFAKAVLVQRGDRTAAMQDSSLSNPWMISLFNKLAKKAGVM